MEALAVLAFIIFSTFHSVLTSTQSTNGIVGTPDIECESRRIQLRIGTKEPFRGRVFIKGNAHRKECVTDFGSNDNLTEIRTIIDYNICNTERIRSLSPVGVTYANTIVVQFHKTFITKGDKSFHVQCFYSESEKTVQSEFDVSMIPTGAIFHDMELPSCSYTVRSLTPNGPLIRSAKVGDTVFHRWECRGNNAFYGMAVHSCFVENTDGRQTLIVDSFGCTVDPRLLPNLIYSDDLGLAYSAAQVFKYPDYSYIHFRCQIRLCTKIDGSCKGITPPRCEENRRLIRSFGSYSDFLSPRDANLDVTTKDILVFEEDNEAQNSTLLLDRTPSRSTRISASVADSYDASVVHRPTPWQMCMSRLLLICILLGFVLFFTATVSFVVYISLQQTKQHHAKHHGQFDDGSMAYFDEKAKSSS